MFPMIIDADIKKQLDFWARVRESDGFDVEHLMDIKPRSCFLSTCKYEKNEDYPTIMVLYARFGLHNYNMIQGTHLQLSSIEKENERRSVVCSAYYITLVAKDPAAGGCLVPFQTKVLDEFYTPTLTCDIARPKPGAHELPVRPLHHGSVDDCEQVRLPDKWPSENALNDKKRYYVVKKSELRKHDWIRLYMELAFHYANTKIKKPNLSKLVIVKVAVETKENVEPPNERLEARNAIFYIKYKYQPSKGRALKLDGHKHPRDRIAIIKRTMDKNKRLLRLEFGKNSSVTQ